ncbi:MAG: Asp-tRNA(Asn)/Glu-tRNA(Gln) amidotransferase subunit GatC [Candidatus Nitrotoga sp.]
MSLSINDVFKVAQLARLEMTEQAAQTAHVQLLNIFGLIAEMQAVDTSGIEPMSHAQDITQRLREDVITEHNQREIFQAAAPHIKKGLYLVPQVIE